MRVKGHFSDEWKQLYNYYNYSKYSENPPKWLAPAKNSEYITTTHKANYPAGAQVDFQVEAITMYDGEVKAYDHFYDFIGHLELGYVLGEESGWSNTQTITIGDKTAAPSPTVKSSEPTATPTVAMPTLNPTQTPSQPDTQTGVTLDWDFDWQTIALIGMALAIAVMAVGMVVLWRRIPARKE